MLPLSSSVRRHNPKLSGHHHRMRVDVSTFLPCDLDQAIAQVRKPKILQFIAAPLVRFTPVSAARFPDSWPEGTFWVRLHLFGLIPLGKQAIVISMPPTKTGFALRDDGHSRLIKTWDHLITIEPHANGSLYRDRVEVKAGVLTPFVWLFAQVFYRHRQRRWRKLAALNFNYGGRGDA